MLKAEVEVSVDLDTSGQERCTEGPRRIQLQTFSSLRRLRINIFSYWKTFISLSVLSCWTTIQMYYGAPDCKVFISYSYINRSQASPELNIHIFHGRFNITIIFCRKSFNNYSCVPWLQFFSICGKPSGTPFILRWRHNDHDGISNHQPHGCLLNRLFKRRSKKTSKLSVTGLWVRNSPGPVNSPHKGPVTRKILSFDDVIMTNVDQL